MGEPGGLAPSRPSEPGLFPRLQSLPRRPWIRQSSVSFTGPLSLTAGQSAGPQWTAVAISHWFPSVGRFPGADPGGHPAVLVQLSALRVRLLEKPLLLARGEPRRTILIHIRPFWSSSAVILSFAEMSHSCSLQTTGVPSMTRGRAARTSGHVAPLFCLRLSAPSSSAWISTLHTSHTHTAQHFLMKLSLPVTQSDHTHVTSLHEAHHPICF